MKLLKGAIRHIKTSSTSETQVSTRFRLPGYMFGAGLDDGSKEVFDRLQSTFKRLVSLQREKEVVVLHLETSDILEEAFSKRGIRDAIHITTEFFDYLRSKFLSNDPVKMQRAIDLLDFLMKNATSFKEHGHIIHHLIGRKRMMKTLARAARNLTRSGGVDPRMRVAGVTILGCIQVWGEAFSSGDRQELYCFYGTMKQLEEKYNVALPFLPYDPDRVPILLRNITPEERRLAMTQAQAEAHEPDSGSLFADDDSIEDALGLHVASQASREICSGGEVKESDLLIFDSPPVSPRSLAPIPHSEGSVPAWMTEEPHQPAKLLSSRQAADLFELNVHLHGQGVRGSPSQQLEYQDSYYQHPQQELEQFRHQQHLPGQPVHIQPYAASSTIPVHQPQHQLQPPQYSDPFIPQVAPPPPPRQFEAQLMQAETPGPSEPLDSLGSLVTGLMHDLRKEEGRLPSYRKPEPEEVQAPTPLPPTVFDQAALALSELSIEEATYVTVDPPAQQVASFPPMKSTPATPPVASSTVADVSTVAQRAAHFESLSSDNSQDYSPSGSVARARSSDDMDIRFFGPSRIVLGKKREEGEKEIL